MAEPRAPLPRGPINYAEQQMAQLLAGVNEGNRLLGLILEELRGARGDLGASTVAAVASATLALDPVVELVEAAQRDGTAVAMLEAGDATVSELARRNADEEAAVEEQPAARAAGEGEVKPVDGSGSAPEKRQRHR